MRRIARQEDAAPAIAVGLPRIVGEARRGLDGGDTNVGPADPAQGGLDLLACARRAASMVVTALTVAYAEGLREHKVRRSAASSRETFLRIMERSFSGIAIMLKDTPYA
ncbi:MULTISPECIES: hypothetical protein [Bradyrhizobium]|uniref:hypothetical protein n=1 Tax=Bradyrhizobium TaxID=374 RepID=UPI00037438B5|nr:hypothetical protein [Bradyrhizobium elkanii]MBP2431103.1 hypothetical protein [Bradyrhizobium elkanii]MCP1735554.1 hypothetical protein [Bradyrhizobium elkanii]MCP1753354.1 hypothetical protein [Bradyrhizobium elkanii]MCP1978874.1 hypothetical protein [Bradyrhizobium elkanii]MCS3570895.1 hypothetical protein [Bradyrhizobium elkanii]